MRTRQRHSDSRLNDSIASNDSPQLRIVFGAIQWMRNRTNQQLRRISRENRVGVERDYVLDSPKRRCVAYYCRERVRRLAAYESVELPELTSLSLPPHPHALLRIPESRTMEEIEDILSIGSVLQVQVPNSLFRSVDYFRITFSSLSW